MLKTLLHSPHPRPYDCLPVARIRHEPEPEHRDVDEFSVWFVSKGVEGFVLKGVEGFVSKGVGGFVSKRKVVY